MIGYEITRKDGTIIPGTLTVRDNSLIFIFDEVEVCRGEDALHLSIITKENHARLSLYISEKPE
ncbi:hypothetical protein LCGC14_0963870 [marine sediment metagenome]|uniref:Uncharacterized protein n=1 Tax=marine sediment metagenome TaxID=412755 RepID=A0A0F9NDR3_9ZZZZ